MRIAVASDHAGFELKESVKAFLDSTYTAEERHQRRLEKVRAIETRYAATGT
jgi:ribose 5-phosphate isomerase RpiB